MTEHPVLIPSPASLVGVFADAGESVTAERPAVVLLNAGVLHRIGPNRLHVRIARELARRGFSSLRFDFAGTGDSPGRRDSALLRAAGAADTAEALEWIAAKCGIASFVLAGVCSGADVAFRVALADPRVVGLILIDGLPYMTRRAALHHDARRLFRYGGWRKLLPFSAGARWRRRRRGGQPPATPTASRRDVPAKAEAEASLRQLTQRGVRILAVYTEGRDYFYRGQFYDLFPSVRRDRIEVAYLEGADHTLTLLANQDRVLGTINQWMTRVESSLA